MATDLELASQMIAGDHAAHEALARRYLHVAERVALRFARRGHAYDDILSVAIDAFDSALRRYDPTRSKAPLEAYLSLRVLWAVMVWFRSHDGTLTLGRLGTVIRSVGDAPLEDCEAGDECRPDVAFECKEARELAAKELAPLLDCLTAVEQDVIKARWLSSRGEQKQSEVARERGLTRQMIHKIEKRALAKMRARKESLDA